MVGKITLEIGRSAFDDIIQRNDDYVLKEIKTIKDVFENNTKHAQLEVIIYDGMKSLISSGRTGAPDFEEVEHFAELMNQNGIRFFLALNGGLGYNRLPWDQLDNEKKILEFLHNNGEKYNLQNGVVIGHDDLLGYVNDNKLNLTKVASCLRRLDYTNPNFYNSLFRDYDIVVPINQHTSRQFLEQYMKDAERMMLFLTLGCNSEDLKKCYAHYLSFELKNRRDITGDDFFLMYGHTYQLEDIKDEWVHVSSHGFNANVEPFTLDIKEEDRVCHSKNTLINREDELKYFISAGVNKFKIARDHWLEVADIGKLAWIVEEVYSKLGHGN